MKNEDNSVPSTNQDTSSKVVSLTDKPSNAKVEDQIASHAAKPQAPNGEVSINEMRQKIKQRREADAKMCLEEIRFVCNKYGFSIEASVTITGNKLPVATYGLVDNR